MVGIVGTVHEEERWRKFLKADSHTSSEFRWAWNTLTTVDKNIWQCLGKEPSEALKTQMESPGGENVDESTWTEVVEQREGLIH